MATKAKSQKVDNKVIIQKGDTITELPQTLTVNPSVKGSTADTLISFNVHDETANMVSLIRTETKAGNIKYTVKINAKMFTTLPAELKADPSGYLSLGVESVTSGQRPVSLGEKNNSLTLTVKGKDGKDYTLTVEPTKISLKYGDQELSKEFIDKALDPTLSTDFCKMLFKEQGLVERLNFTSKEGDAETRKEAKKSATQIAILAANVINQASTDYRINSSSAVLPKKGENTPATLNVKTADGSISSIYFRKEDDKIYFNVGGTGKTSTSWHELKTTHKLYDTDDSNQKMWVLSDTRNNS